MCSAASFDLAAILPHLGRNAVKVQLAVDFLFRGTRDALVVVQAKQPILAQGEAELQGALAQGHVVVLRTGEVLQRRAIGIRRKGADIHLQAVAEFEADLVIALGQDLHDAGKAQDLFDQIGALLVVDAAGAGDQHVEIANGFAAAAQRSGRRDFLDALDVPQVLGQLFRGAVGFVQQEAAGDAAIVLDGLQDFLLGLLAHARQFAQFAVARQLLDAGEIAHLESAPQHVR